MIKLLARLGLVSDFVQKSWILFNRVQNFRFKWLVRPDAVECGLVTTGANINKSI